MTFAANTGPWKKLAVRNGLELSYWHATPVKGLSNPYAVAHDVKNLLPLITKNTRIVAITACSNILGSVVDVKSVVKQVCGLCTCVILWRKLPTTKNRFARKPLRKAPRNSRSRLIVWRTPPIERSMYRTGMSTTQCLHSTRCVKRSSGVNLRNTYQHS